MGQKEFEAEDASRASAPQEGRKPSGRAAGGRAGLEQRCARAPQLRPLQTSPALVLPQRRAASPLRSLLLFLFSFDERLQDWRRNGKCVRRGKGRREKASSPRGATHPTGAEPTSRGGVHPSPRRDLQTPEAGARQGGSPQGRRPGPSTGDPGKRASAAQSAPGGLAWDAVRSSCPPRSPGGRCGAGAPAPAPHRSFAAANVRKRSSAPRPPPPPAPHPRARPLAAATLATPDAPGGWRRGRPPGSAGAGGGRVARSPGTGPALGTLRPALRARLTPRAGPGWRAAHIEEAARRARGLLGRGRARDAGVLGLCPRPRTLPLLPSRLRALFSGLITFRIKANPAPDVSRVLLRGRRGRRGAQGQGAAGRRVSPGPGAVPRPRAARRWSPGRRCASGGAREAGRAVRLGSGSEGERILPGCPKCAAAPSPGSGDGSVCRLGAESRWEPGEHVPSRCCPRDPGRAPCADPRGHQRVSAGSR